MSVDTLVISKNLKDKIDQLLPQDDIENVAELVELKKRLIKESPRIKTFFVDAMGIQYCDKDMQTIFEYSIAKENTDKLVHTFDFYEDNSVYTYVEKISFD